MASKVKFFADLGVQSKLNTQVDGDLTVAGDLTVTGTTLTVNSTTTSVGDSMFEFANQNTSKSCHFMKTSPNPDTKFNQDKT